ncbi:MAG: GNAT family N-acetyltransferase [Solirubrobacteraceae bacterium]
MLIRREKSSDTEAVSAIITAAFGRGPEAREPLEVELMERLRADDGWLPRLSLVAVVDDAVVGHVLCTRGHVDDRPALGLGPISVLPNHQRAGIGHALMHAVLAAAEAIDEPLVCVLGDPVFYRRFGFAAALQLGILARDPDWGSSFQARRLSSNQSRLRGTFRYASPFAELGLA